MKTPILSRTARATSKAASSTDAKRAATDPHARGRRIRARVVAGVGSVLLGAVAVTSGMTLLTQHLGERAWRDDDVAGAARWFALGDHVDVAQRWIAPYNRGVAAYSQGEWRNAADLFARAAETVPESARCRVLINQSLALESLGDALRAEDDAVGARQHYREAQGVLESAQGCSGESAETGDQDDAADTEPDHQPGDQPSKQPSDQPTDQPSGEPSDTGDPQDGDGQDGESQDGEQQDGEPQDGEAREGQGDPGSEQQQVDAANQRLEGKLSDGRVEPAEDGEPTPSQADQLAERNEGGARQQQQSRDDSQSPGDGSENKGRTW